jgi:hypothetical protein
MCIHIFSIVSIFSRHDSLIVFSPWAIYSIYCATYSIYCVILLEYLAVLNEYTIPICDKSYSVVWGDMIIMQLFVEVSKQPTDLCYILFIKQVQELI